MRLEDIWNKEHVEQYITEQVIPFKEFDKSLNAEYDLWERVLQVITEAASGCECYVDELAEAALTTRGLDLGGGKDESL